jgi:hypothetical protein
MEVVVTLIAGKEAGCNKLPSLGEPLAKTRGSTNSAIAPQCPPTLGSSAASRPRPATDSGNGLVKDRRRRSYPALIRNYKGGGVTMPTASRIGANGYLLSLAGCGDRSRPQHPAVGCLDEHGHALTLSGWLDGKTCSAALPTPEHRQRLDGVDVG